MHNILTENINKIAFSASDDNKRETTDGVISNPYHIGSGIVCKENLMRHLKIKRLNITINFDLSQEKMHRNTIQTDHKFLIIHTRY